ncbi:MAG: response regulator transcription factor [Halomonas sp.]|uniref:response regulator transcription factor n=1 Tax=Halomonas sp. TaxID=1486246 RepID=UPI001826CF94|nr:response regulator transcription factor [Halomonas sp.]NWN81371.1 response regulator transcription factor [Halomonas sp.]
MRFLLVEDDALLADSLLELLRGGGHRVEHLSDGDTALARLASAEHGVDLLLLDLNLPGTGGLEVLEALRQHDPETPVLILTARGAVEDRVRGLDLGADDYLGKPFSLDELEARVRALLRRHSRTTRLSLGPLELDVTTLGFTLDGDPFPLPPREQRLLACLLRHAGEPVDKSRLAEQAFSGEPMGDNAIEVYVHRLRKRLPAERLALRTVRGLGYLLEGDP